MILFEVAPQITITREEITGLVKDGGKDGSFVGLNDEVGGAKLYKNPNGILYEKVLDDSVSFFTKNALITIEVLSAPERYGFSHDQFFNRD